MEKILSKTKLDDWVAALSDWQVSAPVMEDGIWSYQPSKGNVQLEHSNTTQPPKGFSFPQREVFFSFEQIKGEPPKLTQKMPKATRHAVFGVRPCDGAGSVRMDKVFNDHVADTYYTARRSNVAYVGLACNKSQGLNCFCLSVGGSPVASDGMDVLMTDLGDRFFVAAITDTGKALMEAGKNVFAEATAADRKQLKETHAAAVAQPQRAIKNLEAAPAQLKASFNSPLWEELARPCIGCGACTYLCPTCHCFDINDENTSAIPIKGNRVRTWDNCQFPDFTMHTSGHNPRESLGSRLRQRVSHKFQYFHDNFGMPQCTGCGRCITECSVGIDIITVVNKVAENVG
jgi:ferredoxin